MAIEYAGSRRAGRRSRLEAVDARALARRFDWLLFGAVGALVGFGLAMWRIAIHAMTRKLVD